MKQALLILVVAVMALGTALAAAPNLVNEIHSYKMTIQPDAPQVTVTLRVTGASMQVPLNWSVVVTNVSGNVLFQVEHDDAWLDEFFGEKGYVDGCKGHEECKHKWYFEDLPKTVGDSFNFVNSHEAKKLEDWQTDTLKSEAGEFLKKKGLSEAMRTTVIKEIENLMINGNYAVIGLAENPVSQASEFIYVPSLGYFVPCCSD